MVKQMSIAIISMLAGFFALKLPLWESVVAILVIVFIIYMLGQP